LPRARGIHAHKIFKLGRAAPERDARNLRFAELLKRRVPVPPAYDFDRSHPGIPTPMFANNHYGCCVIAGRAHQTLRFERLQRLARLRITDRDVVKEYLREAGGKDTGLSVLGSLRRWRNEGWRAAGKHWRIHSFSEIDPKNHALIRQAVFLDLGIGLGLDLPNTAKGQLKAGKAWDVVSGRGSSRGSWGGHYVYVPGYTPRGPVCVTWGRKLQLTWAFVDRYADEAYAIVDHPRQPKLERRLDLKRLGRFLDALSS
jgi:hypothetical protein